MGNLARSAVVFNREWSEGRNKQVFVRDVTLTLTGQGGGTNKIEASTLGLLEVLEVPVAVGTGDDILYVASPSNDGSQILIGTTPGDVTDEVRMIVKGRTE